MGKGFSQRRREANYTRAKQAKSGAVILPPPPDEVRKGGKKRKRGNLDEIEGSRSFKRMMSAKGAATNKSSFKKSKNKFKRSDEENLEQGRSILPNLNGRDPISGYMGSTPDTLEKKGTITSSQDKLGGQLGDIFSPKKGAKTKRKLFQKEKKLKKKGKLNIDEEDLEAEELERKIMTDNNKPAFGEQAMQPIKVNLKRKHWNEAADSKSKDRLQQVFKQQMAQAEKKMKQANDIKQQKTIAEAYRALKRGGDQNRSNFATPKSLAALVQKNREMELARPS